MAWARTSLGVDVGTTGPRWALFRPRAGTVAELDGPRRGRVVAALPADQTVFRTVEVPPLGRRERMAALRWELQRILPVAVDDAVFDYVELADGAGGSPDAGPVAAAEGEATRRAGGVRYAVSGAPAAVVDRRLDQLRRLRIRPSVLEPEWVTLWRCAWLLGQSHPESISIALIDFGATSTRVMVVDAGGRPVAFHRSGVGGLALEDDLVRTLGGDRAGVRHLMETELVHDLGPLQRSRVLVGLLGDLARALRRVRTERQVQDGLELWAIGGGAAWPALRETVAETLGEPVRTTGPGKPADLRPWSPLLGLPPRWVLAGTLALWPAGSSDLARSVVVVPPPAQADRARELYQQEEAPAYRQGRGASPA